MTVLRAEGLGKSFAGIRAVADLSFTLAAGEMLALIGPNGAGKTTAFNMIGGQFRPDQGRVWLAGRDVTGQAPGRLARLGMGRTFQVAATFTSLTVRENVQTALLAHHRRIWHCWRPARSFFGAEADALLEHVALSDQAERAAGVLAYGDLKRLELALALAGDPRVLLMDEPTAGMAADGRAALMALVRRLATEHGIAVLFTEHDMDVVFGHADRVLVMSAGALIAEGRPEDVRADARVREVYLGGGS